MIARDVYFKWHCVYFYYAGLCNSHPHQFGVCFQVSNRTVEERVLKLTVFDLDRHKRHNVIGHALFPLRDHDFENNERVVIWRDIEREVSEVGTDSTTFLPQ